jgi:hypothetical protein
MAYVRPITSCSHDSAGVVGTVTGVKTPLWTSALCPSIARSSALRLHEAVLAGPQSCIDCDPRWLCDERHATHASSLFPWRRLRLSLVAVSWTGRGRRKSPGRPLRRTSVSLHPHTPHAHPPSLPYAQSIARSTTRVCLVDCLPTMNRRPSPCQSLSTPTSSIHLTALDARPPRHARLPLPSRLLGLARLDGVGCAYPAPVSEDDGARSGSA